MDAPSTMPCQARNADIAAPTTLPLRPDAARGKEPNAAAPAKSHTPARRVAATTGRQGGFTLIELLVVVAIIVVLIAILIPALSRARGQAQAVACAANLKSFGLAVYTYAYENDNWVPRAANGLNDGIRSIFWPFALSPYMNGPQFNYAQVSPMTTDDMKAFFKARKYYQCPRLMNLKDNNNYLHYVPSAIDYWYDNDNSLPIRWEGLIRMQQLPGNPSSTFWLGEVSEGQAGDMAYKYQSVYSMKHTPFGSGPRMIKVGDQRHFGNTTIVFYDGHAEGLPVTKQAMPYTMFNPITNKPTYP